MKKSALTASFKQPRTFSLNGFNYLCALFRKLSELRTSLINSIDNEQAGSMVKKKKNVFKKFKTEIFIYIFLPDRLLRSFKHILKGFLKPFLNLQC